MPTSATASNGSTSSPTSFASPAPRPSTRPLDDHDAVLDEQVARLAVRLREDGHLGRAGEVLEQDERHRVALLRDVLAHRRDEAADGHALALAARPASSRMPQSTLRRQLVAHVGQRVARDVQPERLASACSSSRWSNSTSGIGGYDVVASAVGDRLEVEDRALAGEPVGLRLAAGRDRLLRDLDQAACAARRWSRRRRRGSRLSSTREDTCCMSTRSQNSHTDPNGPSARARVEDRAHRVLPHVLDRRQPEPDLAVDDREVALRRVDVRRQHLDAHVGALGDVVRHLVLRVHHGRDQRRHVLGRVVRLQVGGAVRDRARSRRRATC